MTYEVLIPYLGNLDLVHLYGVSRLTKSMLTPKDSKCIRFDVLFRMQSQWRVSDETAKLLQTAARFTDVLKIVREQTIIASFPDPRDIDYSGMTAWIEEPLRQWLDKLAALELPTGQEEMRPGIWITLEATASGYLENSTYENQYGDSCRLIGKCTWKD